jgi:hypothetical protein
MVLANKAEVYRLPTYFAGVDLGYHRSFQEVEIAESKLGLVSHMTKSTNGTTERSPLASTAACRDVWSRIAFARRFSNDLHLPCKLRLRRPWGSLAPNKTHRLHWRPDKGRLLSVIDYIPSLSQSAKLCCSQSEWRHQGLASVTSSMPANSSTAYA